MEQFDKNMKQQFDNHQEDIPDMLQWKNTKEGIYQKMDVPKKRSRKSLLWLLLLLPIGFGINGFFNTPSKNTNKVITKTNRPIARATQTKEIQQNNNTTVQTNKNTTPNNTGVQNNSNQKTQTQPATQNQIITTTQSTSPIAPSDPSTDRITTKAKSTIVVIPSTHPPINGASLQNSIADPISKEARPTTPSNKPNSTLLSQKVIVLNPLFRLFLLNDEVTPNLELVRIEQNKLNKKDPKTHLQQAVSLQGGTVLALGQFNSADFRNDYTSWKPGYHTGIQYSIKNKKGWGLAASYNYEMSIQYFELIGIDTSLQEQEVTTEIVRNIYSDEVIRTQSEKMEVKVVRDRNYQTYNTFKVHRISLIGFKQFQLAQKWTLNAGVGLSYTFAKKYQGFTVDKSLTIFQYDNNQNAIFKTASFDGLITGSIGYQLSKHLTAEAYLTSFKSLTNWSAEENIKLQPTISHLGFGLKYGF